MTRGFKDENNKFHPIDDKTGVSSKQLKSNPASDSVNPADAKILKDKKEFISGRPVIGYIKHHPVTIEIELREEGEKKGEDGKFYQNPLVLSIVGNVWNLSRSDINSGGQNEDELREALNNGELKLKENISEKEFEKLLDIWDEWHLNDMNAGTERQKKIIKEHMDDEKYQQLDKFYDRPKAILKDFEADPDNGYNWGSAWLYRPLPKDVVDFVRNFENKLKN